MASQSSGSGTGGTKAGRRGGGRSTVEELSDRVSSQMLYATDVGGQEWRPLPDWARFFIQLGAQIASAAPTDKHIVCSIVAPTRAYAAVFSALGVILAESARDSDTTVSAEHLKALLRLTVGTRVTLLQGNRLLRGTYLGSRPSRSGLYFGVRGRGLDRWVSWKDADLIQRSYRPVRTLRSRQTGQRVGQPPPLLRAILGDGSAEHSRTRSRLDCLVVGSAGAMESETLQAVAYPCAGEAPVVGTLQDVLRVRRFMRVDLGYRCDVLPSEKAVAKALREAEAVPVRVVIFDGSRGYLKGRHRWRSSSWIVILDRTEANLEAATEALNRDYVQRREGDAWKKRQLPTLPGGVEVMVYEEAAG